MSADDLAVATPLRTLRGLDEVRGQPCEIYRTKDTGDRAYERERCIELTIRADEVARYELRFDGS